MNRREKIQSTLKELGAFYGDQLINTTAGQVVVLPMSIRDELFRLKDDITSLLDEEQRGVAKGDKTLRAALTESDPLRKRVFDTDFGYLVSRPLIRVDVVVTQDLQPKIVEVSTARFDGLLYFWAIQEAFRSAGIRANIESAVDYDFSRDCVYPRMVTQALLNLRPAQPVSSKVDKQVVFLVSKENGVFQEFLMIPPFETREGYMSAIPIVADPGEAFYNRSRRELSIRGQKVDIVYYYPPLDLNDEAETIETLLEVVSDRAALVVGLQEILYDNKFLLTRWARSAYVAQTLLVSEENWESISERSRHESVIKLAASCYAKEVHIGTTLSERKYRQLLERAKTETERGRLWVWQEFVDPLQIESENGQRLKLKLSLFLPGGWYGGTMATLAPSYKIHDCWFNAPIKWVGESRFWSDEDVLKTLAPMLERNPQLQVWKLGN